MVDTGYGLGRSWGYCRPALPKDPKYQMIITQTEPTEQKEDRYGISIPSGSFGGQLEFVTQLLGDKMVKLSSSKLVMSMTNPRVFTTTI